MLKWVGGIRYDGNDGGMVRHEKYALYMEMDAHIR